MRISTHRRVYILICIRYIMELIKRIKNKLSYKMDCKRSYSRRMRENRLNTVSSGYYTTSPLSNKVIGVLCVVYGGVTILLPTGSIPMILLGLFLFACPFSIWELLKGLGSDIKYYVGVRI